MLELLAHFLPHGVSGTSLIDGRGGDLAVMDVAACSELSVPC